MFSKFLIRYHMLNQFCCTSTISLIQWRVFFHMKEMLNVEVSSTQNFLPCLLYSTFANSLKNFVFIFSKIYFKLVEFVNCMLVSALWLTNTNTISHENEGSNTHMGEIYFRRWDFVTNEWLWYDMNQTFLV